uniref:Reverse transcriptase domain-containing protein n=1 Tax=Tanacetum cinerariifolium TaxID=118510 RepID=A0A6L2MUL5_TANCI|nr:hypothetical protein [Tanacetum cinerariifolium]
MKYEQCENILTNGTCSKCNSGAGNSFTYDTTPKSFNEVQSISNPPQQSHYNIYLCQLCERNSHYGYECSQRVPLVYEPEPCYKQSFGDNDYPHDLPGVTPLIDHCCCYKCGDSLDGFFCHQCTYEFCGNGAHDGYNCPSHVPFIQTLPSFPQQYPCCEDYRGPHESFQSIVITFDLPTVKPDDSLRMGDEHLDTISEMELDEFIKSSVENLVPNPSESEDLSDMTMSHFLIDSLLDEFADELILLKSIPPRIDETDCDPEEEIRLIEKFLYDNSSPRPQEEFISENSDAAIESFSPSPIPVEDSYSLMEEIDLSFTPDDSMPPGIENDEYDSERDMLILEELLSNNSFSLPENESFHFDIPSSSRPPAKPPDDDEIKPNSGILTVKVKMSLDLAFDQSLQSRVRSCSVLAISW